jgi:hypothetical protein
MDEQSGSTGAEPAVRDARPGGEEHLTLVRAAKLAPGRPSVNCVWRWCREGVKVGRGSADDRGSRCLSHTNRIISSGTTPPADRMLLDRYGNLAICYYSVVLAGLHASQRKYERAAKVSREATDGSVVAFGSNAVQTMTIREHLVRSLISLGEVEEAYAIAIDAATAVIAQHSESHPTSMQAIELVADVYDRRAANGRDNLPPAEADQ